MTDFKIERRELLRATGVGALGSTMTAVAAADAELNVDIRQINRPNFPNVTVFASVRDGNGNTLTNLSKSDFTLTETRLGTSSEQAIESISLPDADEADNISTSVVIDKSSSMSTGTRMENAIEGGKQFVKQFASDDEGLVIAFNETTDIRQRWTTSQSDLVDTINNISPSGSTALFDAVKEGVNEAAPRTDQESIGRSAVVVLADGQDNSSTISSSEAIRTAQQQGVPIYTIGLGNSINPGNLEQLANETGGEYYESADGSDLNEIYEDIAQSIANEYRLTYVTNDNTTDGEEREVRLDAAYNGDSGFDTAMYEEPCAPLPTANFQFSPEAVVEGQQVSFDGSASQPNGGKLVSYEWDFNNDGAVDATGETATHTYSQPGSYDIGLRVEKTCGATDVEVQSIVVAEEPVSIIDITTNDPVTEGDTLEVEIELKNTQFDKENRSVILEDFEGNTVDAEPVQVDRGDSLTITLQWDTVPGDAGTDDITIRVSDIAVTEEVEIQSADVQLSATTGGADGVVPGGRERIDIELRNNGSTTLQNFVFGIDTDSLPEGWTVVDSIESADYDRLNWDSNDAIWTVDELSTGQEVDPSIVVDVPESASVGQTELITVLFRDQNKTDPQLTAEAEVNTVDRFDPTVHGFGFPNWVMGERPDHNGATPSRSEIEDVVRDTILSDLDSIGAPTPFGTETALANILYPLVNTGSATNGHCYGITYAADEYYRDPSAIPISGVSTASEITDPNMTGQDAVGSDIDYYHNVQLLNTETVLALLILKHAQDIINYDNVLAEIKNAIDSTGTAPVALGNDDGSILHQVLAYDYEVNGDTTDVYLYDSSSPLDLDRDVFGPYSHWRWELTTDGDPWDQYREIKLTFDTSGGSVDLSGDYRSTYTNALYLHDGDDIDNPLAAFGTLLAGSLAAAVSDILSGMVSFGISVVSDTVGGILAVENQNQEDPALTVEVVGPSGETLRTLNENVAYSNIEYDKFYYALGAQSGQYRIEIQANKDVEYTVETNGTVKNSGTINDSITETASPGETKQFAATVPDEPNTEGGIEPDTSLPPNLARFDKDGEGDIDRGEVISAINAHYTGTPVGGKPVERSDVISVINAYYSR